MARNASRSRRKISVQKTYPTYDASRQTDSARRRTQLEELFLRYVSGYSWRASFFSDAIHVYCYKSRLQERLTSFRRKWSRGKAFPRIARVRRRQRHVYRPREVVNRASLTRHLDSLTSRRAEALIRTNYRSLIGSHSLKLSFFFGLVSIFGPARPLIAITYDRSYRRRTARRPMIDKALTR